MLTVCVDVLAANRPTALSMYDLSSAVTPDELVAVLKTDAWSGEISPRFAIWATKDAEMAPVCIAHPESLKNLLKLTNCCTSCATASPAMACRLQGTGAKAR